MTQSKIIRVGCRGTDFCRAQTRKILDLLSAREPAARFEIEEIPPGPNSASILEALAEGRIQLHIRGARELPVKLRPGVPLIALERVSYGAESTPLEYTLYWANAESYEFVLRLRGKVPLTSSIQGIK